MTFKTGNDALYLARESSYAQTSRPADSTYLAIPTAGELAETDDRVILETNRNTGRPGMSPSEAGPGQGSLTFNAHLIGLAAQGGDGDAPSADDWLDLIFDGIGVQAERNGEGVASHSGTSLTLDTDVLSVWDLAPMRNAGTTVRWVFIAADAGTGAYTLNNAPGIAGATIQAFRQFSDPNGLDSTDTFAGAYIRSASSGSDIQHAHPGGRITSLSISANAGERAVMSVTIQSDDVDDDTFSFSSGTNGDPGSVATSPLRLACVYIDGSEVEVGSVNIDFGLETAPRRAACNESGRSDHVLNTVTPVVTITPQYAAAYEATKRAQTQQEVIVQFTGTGSDTPRQLAIGIPEAQLASHAPADASGLTEASLVYQTKTVGSQARWVIGRC